MKGEFSQSSHHLKARSLQTLRGHFILTITECVGFYLLGITSPKLALTFQAKQRRTNEGGGQEQGQLERGHGQEMGVG